MVPLLSEISLEERFWSRVNKDGSCWTWQQHTDRCGYGRLYMGGKQVSAHRLAYEIARGPIPPGHQIDHTCHNPPCVNPAHLRAVTKEQNAQNLAGARRNSRSGIRGVHWRPANRKWEANATVNGKRSHLGYFNTPEEAEEVVVAFRRKYMPTSVMDLEPLSRIEAAP